MSVSKSCLIRVGDAEKEGAVKLRARVTVFHRNAATPSDLVSEIVLVSYFFCIRSFSFFFSLNFFLMFIFEREKERGRQSASGGRTEREGDTESEAGSRLRAVSAEPDAGLELTNHVIMT